MRAVERAWRAGKGDWRMHGVSALSSAVAFLCLAFALLLWVNLEQLHARWGVTDRLTAYLHEATGEAQAVEVARALRGSEGVLQARYVSSEVAKDEMLEGTAARSLELLPADAFPASIEVSLSPDVSKQRAAELARQLERVTGVEAVETYGNWTAQVARLANVATGVALAMAALVLLAVVTIVSSSTKLMLERRREEVEVLRIVGATEHYVSRPFMVEGAVQGAVGALGAVVFCGLLFVCIERQLHEQWTLLLGVSPRFLPWFWTVCLVAGGGALGAVAARWSLGRWLHA